MTRLSPGAAPPPDTSLELRPYSKMKLLTSLSLAALALTLPVGASATTADHTPSQAENIVETAKSAGNFKTLLAAAKAAGLVEPLVGKGPLTVLAPTDEAFAKLGDAIPELLRPENKESLARILKYHVIAGSVMASDALKAGSAPTLMGQEVSFALVGGRLRINGEVNVIANDVLASNGVIHVIDQVLIPEAPKPAGRLVIGFFSDKPGEQLANYLGVDRNQCLLVTEVTKGSEAEKAGLLSYDLIVSINDKKATQDAIRQIKEDVGFGGEVRLDILRRGKKVRISSKVGAEDH